VHIFSGLGPEAIRIAQRAVIYGLKISFRHCYPPWCVHVAYDGVGYHITG
jgi:hypothetical protein